MAIRVSDLTAGIQSGGLEYSEEQRTVLDYDQPIPFDVFLRVFGDKEDVELINGVVVKTVAAQLDHESLFMWLASLLNVYTESKKLGKVLGSRTAVQINQFTGRIPDLLFIKQERLEILQSKAVYGAPDFVIEIVSPNDRPSDLIALEADYRSIGVEEIWIINQQKQQARILYKLENDYEEHELKSGTLVSRSIPKLTIDVEWLFTGNRPTIIEALENLNLNSL